MRFLCQFSFKLFIASSLCFFAVTSAFAAETTTPAVWKVRRIVVDAGHGGHDYGAVSPHGFAEKGFTLDLARRLAAELRKLGFQVTLTRDSDVFIPLEERSRIAARAQADFFISLHANASLSHSLRGLEVYYLDRATDDAAVALERAENESPTPPDTMLQPASTDVKAIVWDLKASENRRLSHEFAQDFLNASDRLVHIAPRRLKSAQFHVLKWTECPAVLVEAGYLTNATDERLLKSPFYRDRLARSIAVGLIEYKTRYEATNGFTR